MPELGRGGDRPNNDDQPPETDQPARHPYGGRPDRPREIFVRMSGLELSPEQARAAEAVHDSVDNLKSIFSHPPTHDTVGHVPPSSDMPDPLQGPPPSAGDLASGAVAAAFVVSAVARMMHDKFESWKERHDDNG